MPDINRIYTELEKEFRDYLLSADVQGDSLADIAQAVREGAELSCCLEGEWLHIIARLPDGAPSDEIE